MNDNRLTKYVVFTKIDGKPGRGRLCREWLNDVKDWCKRSRQDLLRLAQGQWMWKKLIRDSGWSQRALRPKGHHEVMDSKVHIRSTISSYAQN